MVNVFVVHSGEDRSIVENKVNELRSKNINVLLLENKENWKPEAKKKIKEANIVLFIVGKNSHKSENIDWEMKQSIAKNKLIIYHKLNKKYELNESLITKDKFSNMNIIYGIEIENFKDVVNRIVKYEKGEYNILNFKKDKLNRKQLLDQYKIYLQTSESLITRRQNVSSFYLSINTALISVTTIVTTLCEQVKDRITIIIVLAIFGIFLNYFWHRILESYGLLNASKMKVISIIEKSLPADIYDSEWEIMSDKLSNKKYISFTDSEKKIPFLFTIFYAIAIIICLVVIILK